ncbi:hypothetical protein Dsui_2576 [Azospira oryzae PS]|uniref:Uncharacterized protein n=1 Tax=Azospira oryzae (strain ATCC BAA-33 / DSM 13638 / PS) TaxID=640081 RepID=G8QN87_AZOOP|nr:hypothetical protein [Azospira oryzae]AEV26927.1 hypothetical protein Dsui_2576 [Azospira oryzae PS]
MKAAIVLVMFLASLAGLTSEVWAQTVLRQEVGTNTLTLYVDGGALQGPGAQNSNRIVRVEKWACPNGTERPVNGVVVFIGPPRWEPKNITLAPRQCLLRTFDSETGAETDQIVEMVKQRSNGGYYVTAGHQGDQVDSRTSKSNTNAVAAGAAAAAAAGYFNSCSGSAFNLLSDPVPDAKDNPAEYRCYMDYEAHAH